MFSRVKPALIFATKLGTLFSTSHLILMSTYKRIADNLDNHPENHNIRYSPYWSCISKCM